jgi:hypothetical protein
VFTLYVVLVTLVIWVHTRNLRFLARSMKTKGEISRYPRKISLLKDLMREYLEQICAFSS